MLSNKPPKSALKKKTPFFFVMISWLILLVCSQWCRVAFFTCSGASSGKAEVSCDLVSHPPGGSFRLFQMAVEWFPGRSTKCFSNVYFPHICSCTISSSNLNGQVQIQAVEIQTLLFNGRNSRVRHVDRMGRIASHFAVCNTHITKYTQRNLALILVLDSVLSFLL